MMQGMVIDMNDAKLQTLDQLRAFLSGTVTVCFSLAPEERYDFVARIVRRFGYQRLKRRDKGVVLRFLERVSGYSRQQLTRLVGRAGAPATLAKRYRGSRTSFARSFTDADVRLLAQKWFRLFEQLSPIYKWTPGRLLKVQSCPRRRASLATNAKPRWATRGAPGTSSYAAKRMGGSAARYCSSGVMRPRLE